MPPLDLTDAEHIKELVVKPLIEAVRAEMRQAAGPMADEIARLRRHEVKQDQRMDQIEQRLGSIERFKLRIAAVCSGIAVVTGIVWRMLLDWTRGHLPK